MSYSCWFLKFDNKCRIAAHLEAMEFDVSLVATEWFLCVFSKSLPSEVPLLPSLPPFVRVRVCALMCVYTVCYPVLAWLVKINICLTCSDNLSGMGRPFL